MRLLADSPHANKSLVKNSCDLVLHTANLTRKLVHLILYSLMFCLEFFPLCLSFILLQ